MNIPKHRKKVIWQTLLVFLLGFLFNVVWEQLHHVLYVHYKGGPITDFILLRAALFDGFMIAVFSLPFILVRRWRRYAWLIVVFGVLFAIGLEWFALVTNRWAYQPTMPIIPIINTGLTPTIQLGLLGYLSYFIAVVVLSRVNSAPREVRSGDS